MAAELKTTVIQLEIVETDPLLRQCTTPTRLILCRWTRQAASLRFIRSSWFVKNSVPLDWPCQALLCEFLQINSDGFRLAPWTFPGIRRKITFTFGLCSPLPDRLKPGESGGPGKWGVRETGKVLEPLKHQEGFGHVTSLHLRNRPITESASSLKLTQHPDPLPTN